MKILAITQARIGSTRFPEKILKTIQGQSLLEIHLKRILQSKMITKLKVATTTETDSDKIVVIAKNLGVDAFKGSVDNVLDRFYQTALPEKPDWVVRLTSDCPLIDPIEIDNVIHFAIENDLDYASNTLNPTFPDGIDVEVFKFQALKIAYSEANLKSEMEHVTPYIWKNSSYKGGALFKSDCFLNNEDFSEHRITVDTIDDFELIKQLVLSFGTNLTWREYIHFIIENPNLMKLNNFNKRNEGYLKSINNEH